MPIPDFLSQQKAKLGFNLYHSFISISLIDVRTGIQSNKSVKLGLNWLSLVTLAVLLLFTSKSRVSRHRTPYFLYPPFLSPALPYPFHYHIIRVQEAKLD